MDNEGLYGKFEVRRKSDPTRKHESCEYFVLDLTHDRHALTALATYAEACRLDKPRLSVDLGIALKKFRLAQDPDVVFNELFND
jgi:hypothetical protein